MKTFLVILAVTSILSCKSRGHSTAKYISYVNQQQQVELSFCDSMPNQNDSNNSELYKTAVYDYMVEQLFIRILTLSSVQPGNDIQELKSNIPPSCINRTPSNGNNSTYYPETSVDHAIYKFTSEEEFPITYPAFFYSQDGCSKPHPDIVQSFKTQKVTSLYSDLELLCNDSENLLPYLINPTIAAAFFSETGNNTHLYLSGYCFILQRDKESVKNWSDWDKYQPWILGGVGMIGGFVANIYSGFTAGLAVDAGIFVTVLSEHLIRQQHTIQHVTELKSRMNNSLISQQCSIDRLQNEIDTLEDTIFWDVMGYAAGFAIGWVVPGSARFISELLKNGKATIKSTVSGLIVDLPISNTNITIEMPSFADFQDLISSAFKKAEATINIDMSALLDIILARYKSLLSSITTTNFDQLLPKFFKSTGAPRYITRNGISQHLRESGKDTVELLFFLNVPV